MGVENPLTIHEIYAAPRLLPLNRQRIVSSKVKMCVPVYPMSVF